MTQFLIVLAFAGFAAFAPPALAQGADVRRDYQSMSQRDREREMQESQWKGPSGFWTSPHKSAHGSYRYRLLLLGLGLMGITGLLTWRLIKRTKSPAILTVTASPRGGSQHAAGRAEFPTARALPASRPTPATPADADESRRAIDRRER